MVEEAQIIAVVAFCRLSSDLVVAQRFDRWVVGGGLFLNEETDCSQIDRRGKKQ